MNSVDRAKELLSYHKLVREVLHNKDLTEYKNLEFCRENLLTLFSYFNLAKELDPINKPYLHRDTAGFVLEGCIALSANMKGRKIKLETVKAINTSLYPTSEAIIEYLMDLYNPEVASYNLSQYCKMIFYLFFDSSRYWKFNKIDTGNNELDEIFDYLKTIHKDNYELYCNIHQGKYRVLSTLIVSYLHLNHALSKDLFAKYVENMDYYIEKLKLAGLENTVNILQYDDVIEYIFKNFDAVFQLDNVAIR